MVASQNPKTMHANMYANKNTLYLLNLKPTKVKITELLRLEKN